MVKWIHELTTSQKIFEGEEQQQQKNENIESKNTHAPKITWI